MFFLRSVKHLKVCSIVWALTHSLAIIFLLALACLLFVNLFAYYSSSFDCFALLDYLKKKVRRCIEEKKFVWKTFKNHARSCSYTYIFFLIRNCNLYFVKCLKFTCKARRLSDLWPSSNYNVDKCNFGYCCICQFAGIFKPPQNWSIHITKVSCWLLWKTLSVLYLTCSNLWFVAVRLTLLYYSLRNHVMMSIRALAVWIEEQVEKNRLNRFIIDRICNNTV